jgi:hypothetical protein
LYAVKLIAQEADIKRKGNQTSKFPRLVARLGFLQRRRLSISQLLNLSEYIALAVPRCSAAHRTAARRPFCTSTVNQISRLAARQIANKNGKPSQLLPDLLMITWITFGPIMDDARLDNPNNPKNYILSCVLFQARDREEIDQTHHVVETWWGELGHHGL